MAVYTRKAVINPRRIAFRPATVLVVAVILVLLLRPDWAGDLTMWLLLAAGLGVIFGIYRIAFDCWSESRYASFVGR
jgi:hypothetical protein